MLVVLSCCHKDTPLALANAEWIASLGGSADHKWVVAVNQLAGATDMPQRIVAALKRKYAQVELLVHYDADERPWPRAQNHAFQRSAQYVAGKYNEPWLWLECDAIPLGDGWLDALDSEYQECLRRGKVFMGMLVDVTTAEGQRIPQHLSGVSVYPPEVAMHSVNMMTCSGIAFDMAGAEDSLHKAHFTNLIFHKYQCPSISRDEEFNAWVPKEALLLHQQKDAKIIEYLKSKSLGVAERFNADTGKIGTTVESAGDSKTVMSGVPTEGLTPSPKIICDIFIKTWPRDYDWLYWCMMSIEKFATGFRRIIFVSPDDNFKRVHGQVIVCPDAEPGYLHQQVAKLHADLHTDADFVLFMDSDTIFTRPVTPETFMRDGKVMWNHAPFRDDEKRAWAPVMEKFMGEQCERSFMTRHPFVFPRFLFGAMRDYCRYAHNQELSDYIMSQHKPGQMLTFSEFNCAGAFAYKFHRDKFVWLDTEKDEIPEPTVFQGFTHGGEERKQQDLADFARMLADAPLIEQLQQSVEIVRDVKYHVSALAELAKESGLAKGRITLALKRAGLTGKK